MNREQLAWAAGIVDGEGCFDDGSRIGKTRKGPRKYYSLRLAVSQATPNISNVPEMVLRLRELFPLSHVYGPKQQKKAYNPQYRFEARGFQAVQNVAASIWPWLGKVKPNQYTISITKFI